MAARRYSVQRRKHLSAKQLDRRQRVRGEAHRKHHAFEAAFLCSEELLAAIFGVTEYREPVGQIVKKAQFRHERGIGRVGAGAVPATKFADCRLQVLGHAPFCEIGRAVGCSRQP